MDIYEGNIRRCPLFAGIEDSGLRALLDCLAASRHEYEKNQFIFVSGDSVHSVGVVLSGGVHIVQEDFWGRRTILAHIETSELFGEAFSCSEIDKLPVSVIAAERSQILFIDYKRIIKTCPKSCVFHTYLIKNMVKLLAQKNIMLTQKMEIVTHRTTRERVLAYLSLQALKTGKSRFTIPFNRQELADYLSVERSAMSAELSRMQAEGLIKTHRSEFELLT